MRKRTSALLAALVGSAAALSAAQAQTLRYAVGWPPNSNAANSFNAFAETLKAETNGDMTVEVYPLSLLNFMESASGVKDGIADLTTILLPYFQAEFPASNFGTELAALADLVIEDGDDVGPAYAGAFNEWLMLDCPACQEEFAAQNAVFLGGGSSTRYHLICNKKVSTLEELQGARIRAGGAWWSRWASAMGATPVSMSINETFEALSQGVLDCSASSNPELKNFGFIDVAKHITEGAPGSQFPSATAVMNRDSWQSASEDERRALLKAAAAVAAEITWVYIEESRAGIAEAESRGIPVEQAAPDLLEKSRAHVASDPATVAASYAERFGLENADQLADKMKELIGKWAKLTEGVEGPDQLADLYWNEVMSKIDVSTYGQ